MSAEIPDGYLETKAGVIPKEWEIVKLSELCVGIQSGFASGERDEDGIIQLRMNNITTEGYVTLNSYLKVPKIDNIEDYLLKYGDILFNNTNSVDLIGKTAIFRNECDYCSFSNHLTRINVDENKTVPEWILYNFIKKWEQGYFRRICQRHVGQAGIGQKDLKKTVLPKPPLSEQRKIATILSSVDAIIQETDAIIAQTEQVKRGLMQELFTRGIGHTEFQDTKVGRIPVGWKVKKLGEIANIERGKFSHRPRNDPDYYGGGTPFIQTGDVCKSNGYILNFSQTLNQRGLSVSKIFPKGTIVITIAANIGYSGILKFDAAFPDSLIGILSHSHVDNEYLNYYLSTQQIEMDRRAIEGAQKNINIPFLNSWYIKLPPPHEQRKIATLLSYVDEKLEAERGHRAKLETMKKGLMQDLLTGKKRVKVDNHA